MIYGMNSQGYQNYQNDRNICHLSYNLFENPFVMLQTVGLRAPNGAN